MAMFGRVAIATQFVSAMDGIDYHFFRLSHFKECVAIMFLIVDLFFPLLLKYFS